VNITQLIVMDFSATWCGPCKMIAPHYAELSESEEFGRAVFLKVVARIYFQYLYCNFMSHDLNYARSTNVKDFFLLLLFFFI
jgi:thiol-disulfide isomerase/thioredoxin